MLAYVNPFCAKKTMFYKNRITFVKVVFILELRVENKNGKKHIFDAFRQKWVVLTPEEGVRQQFCQFLVDVKSYPQICIANECTLSINGQSQRCDTVVYSKGVPIMLVEYKAPSVKITQDVINQALRYNTQLHVPYLVVTNGIDTYCFTINYQTLKATPLTDIPEYKVISSDE